MYLHYIWHSMTLIAHLLYSLYDFDVRLCPPIRDHVCTSVDWSVGWSVHQANVETAQNRWFQCFFQSIYFSCIPLLCFPFAFHSSTRVSFGFPLRGSLAPPYFQITCFRFTHLRFIHFWFTHFRFYQIPISHVRYYHFQKSLMKKFFYAKTNYKRTFFDNIQPRE